MTIGSTGPAPRSQRWLVILVVVMGILIVLGVGVIIFEMGRRLLTPARSAAEAPRAATAATALAPEITIDLPEGAQVTATYSADNRLWAEVQLSDGATAVWIIDLATGKVLSVVKLRPLETIPPRR